MPAFFLVHQFIFNLSDTVPLLLVLPRFCYAEMLGLALFVLWLRWSLCQSFMVRKRKKDVPSCSHRTFQLPCVKVQSLLDCYLFKKKKNGTVCVAWCSHGHWIKKKRRKKKARGHVMLMFLPRHGLDHFNLWTHFASSYISVRIHGCILHGCDTITVTRISSHTHTHTSEGAQYHFSGSFHWGSTRWKQQHQPHWSLTLFVFITATSFFCLLPLHAFTEVAVTATRIHMFVTNLFAAFCQLFSSVLSGCRAHSG